MYCNKTGIVRINLSFRRVNATTFVVKKLKELHTLSVCF